MTSKFKRKFKGRSFGDAGRVASRMTAKDKKVRGDLKVAPYEREVKNAPVIS
jgi:hypothetical protein